MQKIVKVLRKRAVEIGPNWGDNTLLNSAADVIERLHADAARYQFLRSRDIVDTIFMGGVFAGITPENAVLNGDDLDAAIDAERGGVKP